MKAEEVLAFRERLVKQQVVWAAMEAAMREAWFYLEPWWGAEDLWAMVRRRHPELESHRGVLSRQLYCLEGTGELERRGQDRPGEDHTCYRASEAGRRATAGMFRATPGEHT